MLPRIIYIYFPFHAAVQCLEAAARGWRQHSRRASTAALHFSAWKSFFLRQAWIAQAASLHTSSSAGVGASSGGGARLQGQAKGMRREEARAYRFASLL